MLLSFSQIGLNRTSLYSLVLNESELRERLDEVPNMKKSMRKAGQKRLRADVDQYVEDVGVWNYKAEVG